MSTSRKHGALLAGLTTVLASLVGYTMFNRKPKRKTPQNPHFVISPADGRVIDIRKMDSQHVSFLKKKVVNELEVNQMPAPTMMVVIELKLLDVHVQRSPIAGTIVAQRYYPGKFENVVHSANKAHLANTNEKLVTVIEDEWGTRVAVIQVAGMMARRIVNYVQEGQRVKQGEQIGLITLGSQVVLLLPNDKADIQVAVGDKVTDGETIMAFIPAGKKAP